MLLRRFYVQENDKGMQHRTRTSMHVDSSSAPEPHKKGTRELKTEILPLEVDEVLAS